MPQLKVDCVRVPHPFAGRQQVLLLLLPLDLHVLSLPLAFILSQDQTLHCKCCLILTLLTFEINVVFFEFLLRLFYPFYLIKTLLLLPIFQRTLI